MCISHSVMEGQRQNNPITRVAFVYNGPKGMELAPNLTYRLSNLHFSTDNCGIFVSYLYTKLNAVKTGTSANFENIMLYSWPKYLVF